MNDVLDAIVNYEALPAHQREALYAALAAQPELAQLFLRWQQIQLHVRERMEANLPERRLLVLFALSLKNENYLTGSEKEWLANSRAVLEEAIARYPVLADVVRDIQDAESDFVQLWEMHFESSQTRKRRDRAPRKSSTLRQSRRFAGIFSICLALILASTALFFVWQNQRLETIRTRDGEFKVIRLADGSTVRMFGKSKMTYRRTSETAAFDRTVNLKGQAFFDIVPDSQTFRVATPTALTTAMGTRFSIEAERTFTEVVLTNGKISVDSRKRPGHPVALEPGQMSRIPLRQPPSTPEFVENLTEMLSWTGLMVFYESPLSAVSSYISDYYGVNFSVAPSFRDRKFQGSYDPDTLSLDELLETLSIAFEAEISTSGDSTFVLR